MSEECHKFFGFHSSPLINSSGQVVFSGDIEGSPDQGIHSKSVGGVLTQIAREGDFIPGTDTSERFSDNLGRPVLSDSGKISFVAGLEGPEIGSMVGASIFSYQASTGLSLAVRVGDTAPETEEGTTFSYLYQNISINDSGRIVFHASIDGTAVDGTNNAGIFSGQGGSDHVLLVREGDAVLGNDDEAKFIGFDNPSLNGNGQIAFRGAILGTGVESTAYRSVFSGEAGSDLEIVAREGDSAPGAAVGVRFRSFFPPSLNALGQTAFMGYLEGLEIDDSNDRGIYAEDLAGNLRLIAREGDLLDVSDDPLIPDFRSVRDLSFLDTSGNEAGRASSFNDRGQLAFRAEFTDGSEGIFVSYLVAVPEPSSLALFAIAALAILHRRQ